MNKNKRNMERQFGLALAALAAVFALVPWATEGRPRLNLFPLAVVIAFAAWFMPGLFTYPTRLWLRIGSLLHKVANPIILGLIYLLVILPIGLLMRSSRRKLRGLSTSEASPETYWIEVDDAPAPSRFRDQF